MEDWRRMSIQGHRCVEDDMWWWRKRRYRGGAEGWDGGKIEITLELEGEEAGVDLAIASRTFGVTLAGLGSEESSAKYGCVGGTGRKPRRTERNEGCEHRRAERGTGMNESR